MNPREKKLAILVGCGFGLVVLYHGANLLFIKPLQDAAADLKRLDNQEQELDHLIQSRESLARQWMKYVGQTFSFDQTKAQGFFSKNLKDLAKEYGFDNAVFSNYSGTRIGAKTKIKTVAQKITVEGKFTKVMAFLNGIYKSPYLCQITSLSVTPLGPRSDRNAVKVELTVETPLLPEIGKEEIQEVATAETMPLEPEKPLEPYREHLWGDDDYQLLAARNILRPYMPPPPNVVLVDNTDWEVIFVKVQFFWDGKLSDEIVETVPKRGEKAIRGKGDLVVVQGTYKDSTIFGPMKLDFNTRKNWSYKVPVHSEAPPPTEVDLAIDNRHTEVVDVDIVVSLANGKQKTLPTMRIKAKTKQVVDQYENITSVLVSAAYASGKNAASQVFKPAQGQQVLIVSPESVAQAPRPPSGRNDPAPDSKYTVSGLIVYPEPVTMVKEGQSPRMIQEMIATGAGQRKIIQVGEAGEVDGGTLVGVHPMGGIVKMPSGDFYVYPLGQNFTARVKLEAQDESELAIAIGTWLGQ